MIRLEKHDEIIEAMIKGAGLEDSHVNHMMMEPILDAMLEAVVEKGVGRSGMTTVDEELSGRWNAISETQYVKSDTSFPALILKLEPKS